jgi:hypothetical protein
MVRHKVIQLDPYKCELLVAHGGTWGEARTIIRSLGYKNVPTDVCLGRTMYRDNGTPLAVWVQQRIAGHVAHEALHAVRGLLQYRGLDLSPASEEAYAYLLEFIVRQVMSNKGWK